MGKGSTSTKRGRGRGRPKKKEANPSTPVAPTTQEIPQPAPAPQNTATPTAAPAALGIAPQHRRSPRLKELSEAKAAQREAGEGNLTIGSSTRGSSKKKKAAETVVSSDPAERKEKRTKGDSSNTVTEGNMKEKGTSSGSADPSADFKSLYEAEKKRADDLDADNRNLNDQLNSAMEKLKKYEKGKAPKDSTDTAEDASPDTTEEGTPDATDTPADADGSDKDSA